MAKQTYTFDQVASLFVAKVSAYAGYRYGAYGVTPDDISQEVYVWLYGSGKKRVERWLANEPQQTTRVYRSMLDIAIGYGEAEKARQCGYEVDDVYWFTASSVEGLMPLVLDETFAEEGGNIGELLTSVLDIRRVLSSDDFEWFTKNDDSHPEWKDRIRYVVDSLGGARPHIGRRKVISNAQAQARTAALTG